MLLLAISGFPFRIAVVGYPALVWIAWALAGESRAGAGEGAA
jgi:hypothetical protein